MAVAKKQFRPLNRHVLYEPIVVEKEEKDPNLEWLGEFIPKTENESVVAARVMGVAADCQSKIARGDLVFVDTTMTLVLKFEGQDYLLVPENFVYGILE